MQVNDNTFFGPDRKVRSLNVAANFRGPADDGPAFAKEVAERVRNSGVDLSPYEALHVVVRRQAVTGIGYLSKNYTESFPVAGGKASTQPVKNFEMSQQPSKHSSTSESAMLFRILTTSSRMTSFVLSTVVLRRVSPSLDGALQRSLPVEGYSGRRAM